MSLLDLPGYNDYSLSLRETRIVYLHGELRLDKRELELTEQGFSVEQIARELFALRNGLRTWTRNLMSDRRAAEVLESGNPNATWDELVAICRDEGFTGEGISARSSKKRNAAEPRSTQRWGLTQRIRRRCHRCVLQRRATTDRIGQPIS
ncbi:MAG: hypothetical protein QOH34_1835 [Mycobacterium sp.]|nr:hypothetical protein [Mycobacterium sp.]